MNRQILLVDDNQIQATTRRLILERTGSHVKVAGTAVEALDILNDRTRNIALVVTDHLMPGMNGPEMVRHMRARRMETPVIVLSGLAEAEAQYEDLQVVFRLKPLPPEELILLVQQMIQEPLSLTA